MRTPAGLAKVGRGEASATLVRMGGGKEWGSSSGGSGLEYARLVHLQPATSLWHGQGGSLIAWLTQKLLKQEKYQRKAVHLAAKVRPSRRAVGRMHGRREAVRPGIADQRRGRRMLQAGVEAELLAALAVAPAAQRRRRGGLHACQQSMLVPRIIALHGFRIRLSGSDCALR